MSNFSKDHPSIRVFAPPGGRSTNIFGVPEPEVPVSNKKNHMESDIFGCKKDNNDSMPVKQTRNMTNNIFGTEPDQPAPKPTVYSEKNKSNIFAEALPHQPSNRPDRQRSNIFGTNEPNQSTSTRAVSDKFKSNIFAGGDDDAQNKRQLGGRQGLRVGYNPINGESYGNKDNVNSKVEQAEPTENDKDSEQTVQTNEEENGVHGENGEEKSNGNSNENGNGEVPPADSTQNGNSQAPVVDKPSNGHTNGQSTAKNGHTSVRVFHPPGGRSNGPLW